MNEIIQNILDNIINSPEPPPPAPRNIVPIDVNGGLCHLDGEVCIHCHHYVTCDHLYDGER